MTPNSNNEDPELAIKDNERVSTMSSRPSARSTAKRLERISAVSAVFSPGAPIDQRDLFAGRIQQSKDVLVALNQKGQHVILYGERGVGKTSLANVLHLILGTRGVDDPNDQTITLGCASINCDESDSFTSLWRKIFRELSFNVTRAGFGFDRSPTEDRMTIEHLLPEEDIAPDDVRVALNGLPRSATIIIDEIDTLPDPHTKTLLAHTIKNLSDHGIRSKLIIVGVADSVDDLIAEHASIERSLVQVRMPRMSLDELFEILDRAMEKTGMRITDEAMQIIGRLSQGLPHYTHSLGLYASISAIENDRSSIALSDVHSATVKATEKSPQSILTSYMKATSSPRTSSLHAKVLLACALVKTDDAGMFSPTDIKEHLKKLTGKKYEVASYQRHLDGFCDEDRGPVLKKTGSTRRYRYRFINPMMPPFVVMQGIKNQTLDGDALSDYIKSQG